MEKKPIWTITEIVKETGLPKRKIIQMVETGLIKTIFPHVKNKKIWISNEEVEKKFKIKKNDPTN